MHQFFYYRKYEKIWKFHFAPLKCTSFVLNKGKEMHHSMILAFFRGEGLISPPHALLLVCRCRHQVPTWSLKEEFWASLQPFVFVCVSTVSIALILCTVSFLPPTNIQSWARFVSVQFWLMHAMKLVSFQPVHLTLLKKRCMKESNISLWKLWHLIVDAATYIL